MIVFPHDSFTKQRLLISDAFKATLDWVLSFSLDYVSTHHLSPTSSWVQVTSELKVELRWVICDLFLVFKTKWLFFFFFLKSINLCNNFNLVYFLSFLCPVIWRWLSSVPSMLGRPSPASMSPSTRLHSPWPSTTTRSTRPCPTCLRRAARRQTKKAGWPPASPERPACPRTTWLGPSATSPTERHRQTAASWSVPKTFNSSFCLLKKRRLS